MNKEPIFQPTRDLEYSYYENKVLGNMMRQHYHDGYEVYLHIDGERNVFFNNRKYILKRGSLFIIEPFIMHMTTNSEKPVCSRYIMNFKRSILSMFMSEKELDIFCAELNSCIIQLDEERIKIIEQHFEELKRQWRRFACDNVKRCRRMAYMEVYRLLDRILSFKEDLPEVINLKSLEVVTSPEILSVLRYIEAHYSEEITLDDMVRYANMSKSSFYRAFRKVTGDTFGNYLSLYRLSKAHELVVETAMPFYEIAKETGFSSTAHLSRIFRQEYEKPPSYFRQNENI